MSRIELVRYKDAFLTHAAIGDAFELAGHLRASDIAEMVKAGVLDFKAALADGFNISVIRYSILRDDSKVIALFGCAPALHDPNYGVAWLLADDEFDKYCKAIIRFQSHFIREMLNLFPVIGNYVDEDNVTSRKWLEYMGFQCRGKSSGFVLMELSGGEL